jgi:endonuclease YncB( thermonuclease family)
MTKPSTIQVRAREFVLAFCIALGGPTATAQTITDGDTLKVGSTIYRLWGIDAPEAKQNCPGGWSAGHIGTTKLLQLMRGRTVICEAKDRDRYGRTVAVYRVGSEELRAVLVREGMA